MYVVCLQARSASYIRDGVITTERGLRIGTIGEVFEHNGHYLWNRGDWGTSELTGLLLHHDQ
jgi:hypothetical protein